MCVFACKIDPIDLRTTTHTKHVPKKMPKQEKREVTKSKREKMKIKISSLDDTLSHTHSSLRAPSHEVDNSDFISRGLGSLSTSRGLLHRKVLPGASLSGPAQTVDFNSRYRVFLNL